MAGGRPVIRRKRLRPPSASSCPDLALPKGPPKSLARSVRREDEIAQIRRVRKEVWKRSASCEWCGDTETMTARRFPGAKYSHELHETYSRAKTRGRLPEERFDPRWCVRLCPNCHRMCTHGAKVWFGSDVTGANGLMLFTIFDMEPSRSYRFTPEDVWRLATGQSGVLSA